MDRKCDKCHARVTSEELNPYANEWICTDCLTALESEPIVCPNCKTTIGERDYVGVYVRRHSPVPIPDFDLEMAAIVCPKCKVIFLDDFQYNIVLGLKKKLLEDNGQD